MNTPSTTPAAHPTVLALHEYHLALLPRSGSDEIARHVAGCERCRSELEGLASGHQRFDAEVFPATRAAIQHQGFPRWRRWRMPALTLAVMAAGTALMLVVPGRDLADRGNPEEVLRAKGQLMAVFVARPGGPQAVEDGKTRLQAGDRIRFVLWPEALGHAVVAGLDAAGRVTIYHPWGGSQSAPLPAGPRVEVPGSIELDASPGPERVFAVLSARPLQTAAVVEALTLRVRQAGSDGSAAVRRTERLPIEGTKQQSILLEKTP
jgi:hypothetical protein